MGIYLKAPISFMFNTVYHIIILILYELNDTVLSILEIKFRVQ